MKRFLLIFAALTLAGLILLKQPFLDPAIELFCLGLAWITWAVVSLFDGGITLTEAVLRHGARGFALEVTHECSGLPISWLYLSALVAYPLLTWRHKLLAAGIGILLIQAVNVARLVSLLYLGHWLGGEHQWFNLIHEYFWPFLLNLSALAIFVVILFNDRMASPERPPSASAG